LPWLHGFLVISGLNSDYSYTEGLLIMAAKKKAKKKIVKKKLTKKKTVAKKKKAKKKSKKKTTSKNKIGDRLGGKKSKAVIRSEEEKQNQMYGNSFWMKRSTHGRNPLFNNPEDLFDACMQYFKYSEDNPLMEEKVFCFKGHVTRTEVSKLRALTLQGLCIFIGMTRETWGQYRKKEDYSDICTTVEEIMYNQKLQGASADLLNASIIARHLGLKDHQDHSSDNGSMSTQPLTEKQKELLDKTLDNEY